MAERHNEHLTYLDHAATTPVRPEVVEAMLPFLTERWANPSGAYRFGRDARRAIDEARDVVAEVVGCRPGEVVFTSGGTEADNLAVRGLAGDGRPWCSAAEHHAVLEPVERAGGTVVAVDHRGHIDLEALDEALAASDLAPGLVSVMAVNNEVGTVTDLEAVAAIVRRRSPDAVLHTDAVQAACWLDLRPLVRITDSLSLSAHKFGGPKGVGALVVRTGITLHPMIVGGGQERERRSGTQNVAGIVGMAVAMRLADDERASERERVRVLRDRLLDTLSARLTGVFETVPRADTIPGTAHVCIGQVENEALLFLLDEAGVCASAASACASGAMEPSHVLAAMGVPGEIARGAVRFTLGRTSDANDIDRAVTATVDAVQRLRSASRRGASDGGELDVACDR